jgi:hypothetical protein
MHTVGQLLPGRETAAACGFAHRPGTERKNSPPRLLDSRHDVAARAGTGPAGAPVSVPEREP